MDIFRKACAFIFVIYAHGVVIQVNSEKLSQRVSGLSLIERHLTESLAEIVNSYAGSKFRNSNVSKATFFDECLKLKLSDSSEQLLAERCKLSFHRDMRSSIEYGLDLAFGWLSEDLILKALQRKGISVDLAGEDRYREFLFPNEIGTKSDFCLSINGITRPLEIVFSWNDYWKNTDRWDLRDSKYRSLVRPEREALCLGIELPSLYGFLIDMKSLKNSFTKRSNPAWGNKTAYTLIGMREKLKPINDILKEINQI